MLKHKTVWVMSQERGAANRYSAQQRVTLASRTVPPRSIKGALPAMGRHIYMLGVVRRLVAQVMRVLTCTGYSLSVAVRLRALTISNNIAFSAMPQGRT
jgi:hypothetical protein